MSRVIIRERIPSTDPRLKRHVHHDSESRRYALDTSGLSIVSVRHTRRIPVLDQGPLGSCTGNAGIGALGTDPYFTTTASAAQATEQGLLLNPRNTTPRYTLDEAGAVQLYSDATKVDSYPGEYPPTDTGSDGLTIAKVLTKAGEISGYQHTFTLDDALKALSVTPVITGVSWYDGMFSPDPDGRVRPTGNLAGGHEFVVDEVDAEQQRVWFTNSWGDGWGIQGRAYLSWDDWGTLLADQGDVTVFVPLTAPAPTPVPGDPDVALAAALHHDNWVHKPHIGDNALVAHAAGLWLAAKGL